jgi:DNA-binding CsgD family transcriptional regulator
LRNNKYGHLYWQEKHWLTHRLSYLAFIAPIPSYTFICHHCDIPACLEPSHLYSGDAHSNALDRVSRDRYHPIQKLTSKEAEEIKLLLIEARLSCNEIAKRYGVDCSAIKHILSLKSWSWLRPDLNKQLLQRQSLSGPGEQHPFAKATNEQVLEIKRLRLEGLGLGEIAEIVGLSSSIVEGVCSGATWNHIGPTMVSTHLHYAEMNSYDAAVEELMNEGLSKAEISRKLGIHSAQVSKVCRRLLARRLAALNPRPSIRRI